MANCANPPRTEAGVVGRDGTASFAIRVWSLYDGQAGSRFANRCQDAGCALVVDLRLPGDDVAVATDGDGRPAFTLPLRFAAEPGGPARPALTVRLAVARADQAANPTAQGSAVEVFWSGLAPGRAVLRLVAYRAEERGAPPRQFVDPAGATRLVTLVVDGRGRIDDLVIVPSNVATTDGPITCGVEGDTCELRLDYPTHPADGRFLTAQPAPFPPRP